jgi:hypothetical protein
MFTWICPQCGREVPPSYDACPDCAAREKAAPPAPPPNPEATPVSAPAQPPQVAAPPVYRPPAVAPLASTQYAAPPHTGLPTWLLAILFAFAFLGVGAGVYWAINYFRGGTQAASPPSAIVAAKTPAKPSPFQKYVEVSGIRFVENAQHETEARFVVVNHSDADLADLGGTVSIFGRTAKAEEEAAGTFSFKLASLRPNESKETVAPLVTKLKPYELPDWQNLSAQVQITSPQ